MSAGDIYIYIHQAHGRTGNERRYTMLGLGIGESNRSYMTWTRLMRGGWKGG